VEDLKTLPQQVRENVFLDRMISILSAAFAVLATLLAGVGLYGVLAYSVAQRTREIGVRMALGADSGQVRGLVMKQVGVMTAIGAVLGVAAHSVRESRAVVLYGLEGTTRFCARSLCWRWWRSRPGCRPGVPDRTGARRVTRRGMRIKQQAPRLWLWPARTRRPSALLSRRAGADDLQPTGRHCW
jgi:hypothetical protein